MIREYKAFPTETYESNLSLGFGIDLMFVVGLVIGWLLGKKY